MRRSLSPAMTDHTLPFVMPRSQRLSLDQAAARALSMIEPLRLRHDDGELLAEVFFFREHVLHAHVNGLDGIRAFAALQLCHLRYVPSSGVWPARCSIIARWDEACREAELVRKSPPVRRQNDDEATERIG